MPTHRISLQSGFAHLTDLPCVTLQFGSASAVIALYGAQLLSYQPAPEQEILWLSPLAQWHNQTPIRGGVPVCWPWFGQADAKLNPQQLKLPNHGLVRTRMWQLTQQSSTAQGVSVTLTIQIDNLPTCHQPVTLQLQLTLTDTLSINLQCTSALLQQAALHSYFCIDQLEHARLQPLPEHYTDKVSGTTVTNAAPSIAFTAETDRIYPEPAATLHLSGNSTTLHIGQAGQDATVVWNPWQDKSLQINDLPDTAYQQFVCVETARLQLNDAAPLNLTQQLTAVQ